MDEIIDFQVGDEVALEDKSMRGESRKIAAKIIEVRTIMGMQTFVVETENGKRKVVGANQLSKV